MIESNAVLSSVDEFTASVRIILIDRGGSGIKKLRVLDQFRAVFRDESFNCPPYAEVELERIERGRFPIYVETTDCNDSVTPPEEPILLLPPGSTSPGLRLPCSPLFCPDDPVCREAEARVNRTRNEVLERCSEVSAARSARDAYAIAAATMFTLAAGLFAAGAALGGVPIFGQAFAAIAFIFAVIALGIALGLSIRVLREQINLERAQERLGEARRSFTEAVSSVNSSCCSGCVTVDLIQPACP